jgi:hypothetical protein
MAWSLSKVSRMKRIIDDEEEGEVIAKESHSLIPPFCVEMWCKWGVINWDVSSLSFDIK